MNNKYDVFLTLMAGWLLGIITLGMLATEGGLPNFAYEAVQQCEKELPRHQHCEPVYGAKVVTNGADKENRE